MGKGFFVVGGVFEALVVFFGSFFSRIEAFFVLGLVAYVELVLIGLVFFLGVG